MKSLAIIGMMFCSFGMFAQQSSNVNSSKKEKVCVIDRGQAQNKTNIKLAPMQHVDARKTSVRCSKSRPVRRAHVKEERMIVPLKRKSVKVDANK